MKFLVLILLNFCWMLGYGKTISEEFCVDCPKSFDVQENEPIPEIYSGVNFCSNFNQNSSLSLLSRKDFRENSDKKPLPFSHITQEGNKFLSQYSELRYSRGKSLISSAIRKSHLSRLEYLLVEINKLVFLKNPYSSDHIYIGFGNEEQGFEISQVVGIPKAELKGKNGWFTDFELNTDQAFCFFCGNNIVQTKNCKFNLELKTWGGKSELKSSSHIKDGMGLYKVSSISLDEGSYFVNLDLSFIFYLLYFFIPVVTTLLTHATNFDKVKGASWKVAPSVCYLSLFLSTTFTYLTIILLFIHSFFQMNFDWVNAFFFLILVVFFVVICGFHFVGYPWMLTGKRQDRGYGVDWFDIQVEPFVLIFHTGAWIFGLLLLVCNLGKFLHNYIYLSPWTYFLLSNPHLLNILSSFLAQNSVCEFIPSLYFNSLFIGLFPFTKFGPAGWIDGYNMIWLMFFLVCQVLQISIMHYQTIYGSRFFLPARFRKRAYDKFMMKLTMYSPEEIENLQCDMCMNLLSEPELEYSDADPDYKYTKYEDDVFCKAPCNHNFHPNCILKFIQGKKFGYRKCPLCGKNLPENSFED